MRQLLLLGLFVSLSSHAADLHDALEKAWLRHPQAQALVAAQEEIRAKHDAAGTLTSSPPSLSVSQRGDQFNANRGSREWEAKLGLPLWLPGERDARRSLAETGLAENYAAAAVLRLAIAGELREALWDGHLARNEAEWARERLATAQALEQSVQRRLMAGDLAPVDLNLARHETLAARAALLSAQARSEESRRNWQALTGEGQLPQLPPGDEEPLAPESPPDAHPRLEAARQSVALALAGVRLAAETPRDAPELGLSARSERGSADAAYVGSIGVSLKLTFAGDARNRATAAAANRALIQAESEYLQTRRRLELDSERARQNLVGAVSQLEFAVAGRELARENLKWRQKAFDLGEIGLADLLRTRATYLESELNHALRRIGVAQARARFNQAQGVLP